MENKDYVAYLRDTFTILTEGKGLQTMVDICISKQTILEAPDFICNVYFKACNKGKEERRCEGVEKAVKVQSSEDMLRFPNA